MGDVKLGTKVKTLAIGFESELTRRNAIIYRRGGWMGTRRSRKTAVIRYPISRNCWSCVENLFSNGANVNFLDQNLTSRSLDLHYKLGPSHVALSPHPLFQSHHRIGYLRLAAICA